MSLVVDASVAVKWLVAEEDSESANRLAAGAEDLHAPRLMASEVANTLWRKARLGEIGRDRAGVLMAALTEMPVRWNVDETLCGGRGSSRTGARQAGLRLRLSGAGASCRRASDYGGCAFRECAGNDRTRRLGGDADGLCGRTSLRWNTRRFPFLPRWRP